MADIIIHIDEKLDRALRERSSDISQDISDDIRYYFALLDLAGKEIAGRFSLPEASMICDIFKNTYMDSRRLRSWPEIFAWDMEDIEKYENVSKEYNINVDELIHKLETMTPLQSLWLWDRIRLYWNLPACQNERDMIIRTLFKTSGQS